MAGEERPGEVGVGWCPGVGTVVWLAPKRWQEGVALLGWGRGCEEAGRSWPRDGLGRRWRGLRGTRGQFGTVGVPKCPRVRSNHPEWVVGRSGAARSKEESAAAASGRRAGDDAELAPPGPQKEARRIREGDPAGRIGSGWPICTCLCGRNMGEGRSGCLVRGRYSAPLLNKPSRPGKSWLKLWMAFPESAQQAGSRR